MVDQPMQLDPACRQRLDRHLDAVDQALQAGGVGRGERRRIADDLQNQILEMLAARAGGPNLANVEAVLAELDPPEAYGGGATEPRPGAQGPASVPTMNQKNWLIPGLIILFVLLIEFAVMTILLARNP